MNPILAEVDQIYVINLPHRQDRRREIAAQLRRAGSGLEAGNVTLFPAVRPEDPGPFPSIGARGCFLSHLGVLRAARDAGHEMILILEDDADFTQVFLQDDAAAGRLLARDWAMAWLGHGGLAVPPGAEESFAIPAESAFTMAHAVLVRRAAILGLVPYLETMLTRPEGDPAGGPMHVDGAYTWFRRAHPQLGARATCGQWAVQRASRTDIAATGWKEHIPFLPLLRRLRNALR